MVNNVTLILLKSWRSAKYPEDRYWRSYYTLFLFTSRCTCLRLIFLFDVAEAVQIMIVFVQLSGAYVSTPFYGFMKSAVHGNANRELRAWSPWLPNCFNSVFQDSCGTFMTQQCIISPKKKKKSNHQPTRKKKQTREGERAVQASASSKPIGLCSWWHHAKMLAAALLHQPFNWAHLTGFSAIPGACVVSDSVPGLVSSSSYPSCDTKMP